MLFCLLEKAWDGKDWWVLHLLSTSVNFLSYLIQVEILFFNKPSFRNSQAVLNPGQERRIALRLCFHLCFASPPTPHVPLFISWTSTVSSAFSLCRGEWHWNSCRLHPLLSLVAWSIVFSILLMMVLVSVSLSLSLASQFWIKLLGLVFFFFFNMNYQLIFQFIFSSNFILSPQDWGGNFILKCLLICCFNS